MPQKSFTQKLLEIDITLDPNPTTSQVHQFDNGQNTVSLTNFRTSVRVQHAGVPSGSKAQILVYGLTPSLMNQLSTLGIVYSLVPHNTLSIRAGDAISGLSTIFVGTVYSATPDFNRAPDCPFSFECIAGDINQVAPATASSYPQATDVSTVMSSLAQRMGYGFENNGINIKLPPSYFPGTIMDQVQAVADAANIIAKIVPGALGQSVLAIWPKDGSRSSLKTVPLISPGTGMIGYPSYSAIGLTVKTLFNPQVSLGGLIQIQSSLPKATGTWVVLDLNYELDSQVPDGAWSTTMTCFNPTFKNKVGIPSVS
jgi:hypothetical protein